MPSRSQRVDVKRYYTSSRLNHSEVAVALRSDRELNNRNAPKLADTAGEFNGAVIDSLDRTSGAVEVVVGACFGAGGGYLIDRYFDTSPAFTVILALAGFCACSVSLYRRSKAEFEILGQERAQRARGSRR